MDGHVSSFDTTTFKQFFEFMKERKKKQDKKEEKGITKHAFQRQRQRPRRKCVPINYSSDDDSVTNPFADISAEEQVVSTCSNEDDWVPPSIESLDDESMQYMDFYKVVPGPSESPREDSTCTMGANNPQHASLTSASVTHLYEETRGSTSDNTHVTSHLKDHRTSVDIYDFNSEDSTCTMGANTPQHASLTSESVTHLYEETCGSTSDNTHVTSHLKDHRTSVDIYDFNSTREHTDHVTSTSEHIDHFTSTHKHTDPITSAGEHTDHVTSTVEHSNHVINFSGLVKDANDSKKKDKLHYCLFCCEPQYKLERHLKSKHKEEPKVFLLLDCSDKIIKKKELTKLRNSGDYLHNVKTMKEGRGSIVVKRKSNKSKVRIHNFITCPHCYGYFQKKMLWRHKCPQGETKLKGKNLAKQGSLLMPIPGVPEEENSSLVRQVINRMRSDHTSNVVRNDWLIKKYALCEVKKNGFDPDRHNNIREKLRQLGRLLETLRQQTGCTSHGLEHFINPARFNDIVNATQFLSGNSKGIPSLALKLGHGLNACASVLLATALERGDDVLRKQCEDYIRLHEMKWKEEVSSHALRIMYQKKAKEGINLPLSADILKLSNHVSEEFKKSTGILHNSKKGDRKFAWVRMAKLILVRIILFNRKRQGEVSKMKIKDFLEKEQNRNPDIEQTLDDLEKKMLENYSLVQIIGKRGRMVPVLIDSDMNNAIEDLIKFRESLKDFILPDNNFLFACQHSLGHLRGSDCLKEIVSEANLADPKLLTSTKLRKQIATMTQVVNLDNNELDVVAKFMGHDINVHREFYRLPSSTLQIAKVSKLLKAVETGNFTPNETFDTLLSEQSSTNLNYVKNGSRRDNGSLPDETQDQAETLETEHMVMENDMSSIEREPCIVQKKNMKRDMNGRMKWTEEEKKTCLKHFEKHLMLKTIPGKREIDNCKMKESILMQRSWTQIKNFIRNRNVTSTFSTQSI